MILGKVQLHGQALLAPMAGITDSSFRLICKRQGAAIVFSEMVSADGLVNNDDRTLQYLSFKAAERPIAIQIFGSNPTVMAKAAKQVETVAPDFLDLNFGCPVKKVIKRGAGAAILKDLTLVSKITSAVTAATSLPVTAKIRSGWNESNINAVEVARILEDCGICAITVHPRTQTQLFKGYANWGIIQYIKHAVSIPVIGNGDINNPMDAQKMLTETNCDLIMVGRAALGNPWIFKQINQNSFYNTPITLDQRLNICLQHLKLVIKDKGEYRGVREIRKHLAWYIKGLPYSSSFRAILFKLSEVDQLKEEVITYFNKVKQTLAVEYNN